jgi:hypothetical protein
MASRRRDRDSADFFNAFRDGDGPGLPASSIKLASGHGDKAQRVVLYVKRQPRLQIFAARAAAAAAGNCLTKNDPEQQSQQ